MKYNKIIKGLIIVVTVLISIIIFLFFNINNKKQFVKPKFDKNAKLIPDNFNYKKNALKVTENYLVYIDPMPTYDERNYLKVNFISFEENNIWIKLRVLNSNGDVIAESGLLKPGEYLKKIKLNSEVEANEKITYKIMGYEKKSYMSAGVVSLNTRIGE